MRVRQAIFGFLVLLLVPSLVGFLGLSFVLPWALERAADRVTRGERCWFGHGPDVVRIRDLQFEGLEAPPLRPLQQINRRFVGLGLTDPEVLSPHLMVLWVDAEGREQTAGWSYRTGSFWRMDQDRAYPFVSPEGRDACRRALEERRAGGSARFSGG